MLDMDIIVINIIYYEKGLNGKTTIRNYGRLYASKDFDMFVFQPKDSKYMDDFIVAPATNPTEALKIWSKLYR
ncbi:hypothetical protein [Mobilitalea sibirica]|nr:hypothetical protein [Mobilitalea sibirica]